MTNKVEPDSLTERQKAFRVVLKQAILSHEHKCCLNCENWIAPREFCAKWNERPPAGVIVLSCGDSWMGGIPF